MFGTGGVARCQRAINRDQAHVAALIIVEPVLSDGGVKVTSGGIGFTLKLPHVGAHHQHHGVFVVQLQALVGRLLCFGVLIALQQGGHQQQALAGDVRSQIHGFTSQFGRFSGFIGNQGLIGLLSRTYRQAALERGATRFNIGLVRWVQGNDLVGRLNGFGPFFLSLERIKPEQRPRPLAGVGPEGLLTVLFGGRHVPGVVGGIAFGGQRETFVVGR